MNEQFEEKPIGRFGSGLQVLPDPTPHAGINRPFTAQDATAFIERESSEPEPMWIGIDEFDHEAFDRREYGWLGRLNDRVERWMDRVNWPRFDKLLTRASSFFITGCVLWFLYEIADALLAHAIQAVTR